ncbi:MAG: tRNA (guanosine(46)-N7)-methyltransferase TrmB [Rhodospirillales bacterium]|nr:tRNA (guanosine(46)-N7)-methyltransferase TrmB [Rhodospirillales bacterium]
MTAPLKPPADRLYGRARGHKLRPRQRLLLDAALPRLAFQPRAAADPGAAFAARPAALWLEVGFGGGEHAAAQIAAHPEVGLIAAEVFENGICSLLSRLLPEPADPATAPIPGNLRLWTEDARALIGALPDACLDRMFLLFPDPWPKARHARRRFVHPASIGAIARVLRPGGEWRIASDDPTYQDWVTATLADQAWFAVETFPARPPDLTPHWPLTRYEAKALAAGRSPIYWRLTRR